MCYRPMEKMDCISLIPAFFLVLLPQMWCFYIYNFRKKAKSFAGDVGAICIGFIVLSLVYQLIVTTQNYSYLLLFIVFGIDAGVTVFYKIILRENIFVPHRDFLFKKLVHIAKMKHFACELTLCFGSTINWPYYCSVFQKLFLKQVRLLFCLLL